MKFGVLLIDPDIADDYMVNGVFDDISEAEALAYSYKDSGYKVFVITVFLDNEVEEA